MSEGYRSWSVWVSIGVTWCSWCSWASWAAWPSWCSPEGDVECVADMLRVLMVCWIGRVVASRYNGLRDGLGVCRQGLCRHSEAMACVCADGVPLLVVSSVVWASWFVCFNNRSCASDLYVD